MERQKSRRAWLERAAVGGAGLAIALAGLREALAAEAVSKGVARVRGDARVNGQPAALGMAVEPGDAITTGPDAELVAVVGRDAYLARAGSRIEITSGGSALIAGTLRVLTGALLAVFAPGEPKEVKTGTASIGIRGTAMYVEVEADRTYVCVCYGTAVLVPPDDPQAAETVRTTHHDAPRYLYAKGMPRMIEAAPVVNHTDAELILLESLVGRKPPFNRARY